MSKLNVFIDGSWLYKACGPGLVLAAKTEHTDSGVRVDFRKFNQTLLAYARQHNPDCTELGEMHLSTSVFTLPDDFDTWPDQYEAVLPTHVEQTKRSNFARNRFVQGALDVGYSLEAVYRPPIKTWILEKLIQRKYQEKQVDATVVALLVRSAITQPNDYHCVVTGDSDILPAIRVAYPQYSKNVFVATTHPDELRAEHRQTSFSLSNFEFDIEPIYLQDHVKDFIQGDNVYVCAHCHQVFVRPRPIPTKTRPCCSNCHAKRA